jgi:hypothetical protein
MLPRGVEVGKQEEGRAEKGECEQRLLVCNPVAH